jgi:hypothetical protein
MRYYFCCIKNINKNINNNIDIKKHNKKINSTSINFDWFNIHSEPYVKSFLNPMLNYHPPPKAEPNAPPPTELAAIGSNDSIPIPGVAAPTNGVVSC